MQNQPLVSVLTTSFNREEYIAEAIESVLKSTYKNFELIIVDDCSKDNTVVIAKRYEEKDSRITVYVNETNLGDYANRNKAASYAKGEYIMFVDSDDTVFEDGIEKCVYTLNKFTDAGFGLVYRDEKVKYPVKIDSAEAIHRHFFERPFLFIGPGGTISRRSFLQKVNGYPERYGPANDMYFNLKAACYTSIVLIPFEFVFYREHDGQQIKNTFSYLYNNYRYLNDSLKELPLPISDAQKKWISKKNKRRFTVNIVKYFIKTRDLKKTYHAIKLADFSLRDALIGIFHLD